MISAKFGEQKFVKEGKKDADSKITQKKSNRTESSAEDKDLLDIIERAKKGDQSAFQQIVDKYKTQVASIAYKMVGDYEDAKDISQIVFVKTYQNLVNFDTTKKLSTWLYRITINASIDFIRKHKKHKHELLDNIFGELKEKKQDVEKIYQRNLIKWAINDSMAALNPRQKAVFVLRDLEGLDIKEVAQITGMPQATVRWYLHRARSKLRSELTKHHPQLLKKMGIRHEV
ncbi:MAG: sigma-70 family RNA polymerase sigma factor [candidate division Zixibacteria bacterium]|nr:sigma-70 family RNA polymerase sigma factor [candidate division Zixibacteria bacterium]